MHAVALLIPAYQEEQTIGQVVSRATRHLSRVLVVDDGSTDRTAWHARQAGAEVLSSNRNFGKGQSLRIGLRHLLGEGYSFILIMDADLQHLPEEIPGFLTAAEENQALVLGCRVANYAHMPVVRKTSNALTSWALSKVCRQAIPDTQCGFRLLRADVAALVLGSSSSRSYDFDSEMLLIAARAGYIISSIPITTVYGNERSKINAALETGRFIRLILRYLRFRRNATHPPRVSLKSG